MTGKYAYCSTVPRTFVHDCRFEIGDREKNMYFFFPSR